MSPCWGRWCAGAVVPALLVGVLAADRAFADVAVPAGSGEALDRCAGDCNGDYRVSVSELVQGVAIALGRAVQANCLAVDADGDGRVTIGELVRAVGNALDICPCPYDFAASSLHAGVVCVYSGRWSEECGDDTLQATYAGDGASLGVAVIPGGGAPQVAFLSAVDSGLEATLFGYMVGEQSRELPGAVTLSQDRRALMITPDEASALVIRGCTFAAYDGRLSEIVTLP